MSYTVIFTPDSVAQLTELYRYIAAASSPEVAARYTDSIVTYCESLQSLPHRGIQRDDIRPGLRITSYRKRVVILTEDLRPNDESGNDGIGSIALKAVH